MIGLLIFALTSFFNHLRMPNKMQAFFRIFRVIDALVINFNLFIIPENL